MSEGVSGCLAGQPGATQGIHFLSERFELSEELRAGRGSIDRWAQKVWLCPFGCVLFECGFNGNTGMSVWGSFFLRVFGCVVL